MSADRCLGYIRILETSWRYTFSNVTKVHGEVYNVIYFFIYLLLLLKSISSESLEKGYITLYKMSQRYIKLLEKKVY